jgi:hypothetical protein
MVVEQLRLLACDSGLNLDETLVHGAGHAVEVGCVGCSKEWKKRVLAEAPALLPWGSVVTLKEGAIPFHASARQVGKTHMKDQLLPQKVDFCSRALFWPARCSMVSFHLLKVHN